MAGGRSGKKSSTALEENPVGAAREQECTSGLISGLDPLRERWLMSSEESCLVAQFERIIQLSDEEKALLLSLEEDVRDYPAGTLLVSQGQKASDFFSLRSGWACASQLHRDGSRQIIDIFIGGQIMGLREVGLLHAHTTIETMTNVVACPFPRSRLSEVFAESRRLAVLFFLVLAQSHALLTQRLSNIGNKSATARFAHFILEMRARLNIDDSSFELPLNQTIIGDALGMTSVHVSRVTGELKRKGLIEQEGSRITILDLDALARAAEFSDDYLKVHADLLLP
jgi:CRP-like cAMP-binding protein